MTSQAAKVDPVLDQVQIMHSRATSIVMFLSRNAGQGGLNAGRSPEFFGSELGHASNVLGDQP